MRRTLQELAVLVGATCFASGWATGDSPQIEHFESRVRPILVEKCQGCHGPNEQSSSFRVDQIEHILKGGDYGVAVLPGHPEKSPLVASIRREGDRPMPPDDPLTQPEIDSIVQWIADGAAWPADSKAPLPSSKTHWAFQPITPIDPPTVQDRAWPQNSIDLFIRSRQESVSLTPCPPADRRTLIRRLTLDLTGLVPSPDEVDEFTVTPSADAYERLTDRLLASPHLGESWGRRWLDIARYSDTKGYVYAREERTWLHSWSYRDWVVRSFNEDLPYDRFLTLQIAADQCTPPGPDWAAMGFLTLGRRFLGVTRDIIDDRIDVVTRGTMGLTVGCARCHDHKYDPISTKDYYSLYGVFDSSAETRFRLSPSPSDPSFETGLTEREKALADTMHTRRNEAAERVRARIKDYLLAQFELEKYPVEGFDVVIQANDVVASFARRWRDYLDRAQADQDPVFTAWHAFKTLNPEQFAADSVRVTGELAALPPDRIHPWVLEQFRSPPESRDEVASRYARLFEKVDHEWRSWRSVHPEAEALPDPLAESLRKVLYGPDAPCEPPNESIVGNEFFFPTDVCVELWKLQGEVDRWYLASPHAIPVALALTDRPLLKTPRVFRRGNPLALGDPLPRKFLTLLEGPDSKPFDQGSGRRQLAEAITAPTNPLTARVMVNRLWSHYLRGPLVRTPSDFGLRAEPPTHPGLLDHLAHSLIEEGWHLKSLHRALVTSATYRQSAAATTSSEASENSDPENRLHAHGQSRRMSFEEWRDASLAVSEELDLSMEGRGEDLFGANPTRRRAIYGQIDRQFLPATLRHFDFANPDLHIPQRAETTVPQQALFFLNHPFTISRARSIAALDAFETNSEQRVRALYRRLFQRAPSPEEKDDAVRFVQESPTSLSVEHASPWSYGFGEIDPATGSVRSFTRLPFFTGEAWQGGPNYPDPQLGWAQLSAVGGHAGNDHQHAVIRRWTAPRDLTLRLRSRIEHLPTEGDGVSVFVRLQGETVLRAAVHHSVAELNLPVLSLKAGETVDFIADLRESLNHEEFQWEIVLSDNASEESWDSQRDFAGVRSDGLSSWERLAQALLSSNEFLFID